MDAIDARLKALFAEDEPPARDPGFSARVAEAAARRRLREDILNLGLACLVGAVSLFALAPVLAPAISAIARPLAPVGGALVMALAAILLASGRLGETLGLRS